MEWDGHVTAVLFLHGHVLCLSLGTSTSATVSILSSLFIIEQTLEGHVTAVLSLAFCTHGMQLLSSAADGAMKLWTLKTSECVATYEDEHQDKVL